MKRIFLAIAAAATVLATIVPAYAAQYDTCQTITRANIGKCVIENSQRSGE